MAIAQFTGGVAVRVSALCLTASGRVADWWWQSAPLAEWDGAPRRRTSPPRGATPGKGAARDGVS